MNIIPSNIACNVNILAGVKTRYLKGENKLSTKKRHREILTGPRKKR